MKTKKKLLITSILSIAMCLSLIVGATMAIFTSNSRVNIAVNSGKVDLDAMLDTASLKLFSLNVEQTDTNAQGNKLFVNGGTAAFDATGKLMLSRIAPGDKATFTIDLTNNSNIATKYKISAVVTPITTGNAADTALANALVTTATINGQQYNVTTAGTATNWVSIAPNAVVNDVSVSIELPYTTGNEAQDGNVTITFTVEAVQGNATVN